MYSKYNILKDLVEALDISDNITHIKLLEIISKDSYNLQRELGV